MAGWTEWSVSMKRFNVTGTCYPEDHYMVDISERLRIIAQMVGRGDYFCINAGRQYGKTTTLWALNRYLAANYEVYSISFEGLADASYASEAKLAYAIIQQFFMASMKKSNSASKPVQELVENAFDKYEDSLQIELNQFSILLTRMCKAATRPLVLIIDEVDQAGNHDSFVRILGLLRAKFLERKDVPTFQSVILAGVYDIKNLKLKIRPEAEHQYNSPWNIAARFDVDLALPAAGIEGMIAEYKSDHAGIPEVDCMDAHAMAQLIFDYTSGYPFLVSRLCQILDEKKLRWDNEGVLEAERLLLSEQNTLFDDFTKKLDDYPELYQMLYGALYQGKKIYYNANERTMNIATMFGYIKDNNGKLAVSNRIFETWLYNLFVAKEQMEAIFDCGSIDKNQFIKDGQIDMDHLLSRFALHFNDIYGKNDDAFVEKTGRKLFLLYLKPIINGVGNYYIEAQTRDETKTDVIIDYLGHQYIIELKIWRGNAYNERGEEQLAGYLDYFHAKKGYLVSFCFNKNKTPGTKTIQVGDKTVTEAVI